MKTITRNGITFCEFENFSREGVVHGAFQRHGGCSPIPWNSLNLSTTCGDSRENVIENRRRVLNVLGVHTEKFFDVWQVHSSKVVITDETRDINQPYIQADAITTEKKCISLLMRFADCVPIFLYDVNLKVIGIVHAGWKGTINKIISKTIEKMIKTYGTSPKNLLAGIGPSICVKHYPVGESVIKQLIAEYPDNWGNFVNVKENKIHLDLRKINKMLLTQSGVSNIEESRICTICDVGNWFSHRGENGQTGRFACVISQ